MARGSAAIRRRSPRLAPGVCQDSANAVDATSGSTHAETWTKIGGARVKFNPCIVPDVPRLRNTSVLSPPWSCCCCCVRPRPVRGTERSNRVKWTRNSRRSPPTRPSSARRRCRSPSRPAARPRCGPWRRRWSCPSPRRWHTTSRTVSFSLLNHHSTRDFVAEIGSRTARPWVYRTAHPGLSINPLQFDEYANVMFTRGVCDRNAPTHGRLPTQLFCFPCLRPWECRKRIKGSFVWVDFIVNVSSSLQCICTKIG